MVASEEIDDAYCPVDEEDKIRQAYYIGGDASFELRVQWGYSRCNTFANIHCRPDIPKEFTIHGLWRDNGYNQGPPLVNTVFETRKINKKLQEKMKKCWPSMDLRNGEVNDTYFWSHEWVRHGQYTGWSQGCYFAEAVNLFEKQEITGVILRRFPPGPTQTLSVRDLERGVHAEKNIIVFVKCNTNKDDEQQLQEIGIYYLYKGGKWSAIDHPKQSECDSNIPMVFPYE
ncbi:ribonuclease S-2-like [Papaver somniferum]|uniref:ribonuclease S-2-like n=1 Tax=Papaver somniferum TaxID=3469 RepID=UPI000E6FB8EF|nr:ribonuclease S-2-like [Papaver somniferum]